MSYEHRGARSSSGGTIGEAAAGPTPGKHSLTEALQLKSADGGGASQADAPSIAAAGLRGPATTLPHADRIQSLFGRHSIAGIQAHVGGAATDATATLGAHAYATGTSVAFGTQPDLHTAAHEAAHVIQQRAGVHLKGGVGEAGDRHEQHADAVADRVVRGESAEALLDQYSGSGGAGGVQFSLVNPAQVMPGMGTFNVNMVTVNAPTPGPGQRAGMDGFIQFTPTAGAPNSNTIGISQIVKLTDAGQPNSDVNSGSIGALQAPRGALGQPGLRTQDDAATGVVGGYWNDVLHDGGGAGLHNPGDALSPRYAVEPAGPGVTPWGGNQAGPRGGTGGIGEQSAGGLTPGFKRSDLPEDIRSVAMYDTPGSGGEHDFEFESVVRGEDTQVTYGSVVWGFGTRGGTVVNEHISFTAGASATFNNALDRHRDFYVHEPVTIYFEFDRDNVRAGEEAKITGLDGYLTRNPQVQMTLDGFADQIGNAAYNVQLSQRRVENVRRNILAHFPTATVVANAVVPGGGHGISTAATDATSEQPAGTGDQGGDAANGADQGREANRQFNRRVTITFSHPAGTGPAAPGGVGNPAPAPAAGGGGGTP